MKGFTHFVAGLAVTSFFPWAVEAAAQGNPVYFLLGGTFALLPDTLDFRIIRYFYRHGIEITPDPLDPDMQMVADALAQAIDAVGTKPLRVRLNTIRIGTDSWQRYRIRINPETRQVIANLEDMIDTGGNSIEEQHPRKTKEARADFHRSIATEYLASFPVEMFDGPHLEITPASNNEVLLRFIPWHRGYTHSFGVSIGLAMIAACFGAWQAAVVACCAHASHILLDQLGYMGSNLLWPLSNKRFPGFKLQHASSSFWNFATVWIAIALIYGNLHSHAPETPALPPIGYLIAAIILPLAITRRWLSPAP